MLPLTQQAWGPLSAVAYKNTQPLQRCVYPPTPLTQGTVPCTASQSVQKPVTSALFTQPHQSHGLLPGSGQEHIQGALLINSRESQTSQQDATSLPNQGTQVPISGAVSTQILQHRALPSDNVYLQERQIQRPQPDVISTGIASKNYQDHFLSNIQPQGNMHLLNQPAQESLQPRK